MSELAEDPAERTGRYLAVVEKSLRGFTVFRKDSTAKARNIGRVYDTIHRYIQDSRYYLENAKPATALASVAYAEGLLDALVFLELGRRTDHSV